MVHRVGRSGAALLLIMVSLWILPQSSAADPLQKVSICGQIGFASYLMGQVGAAMGRSDAIIHSPDHAPADWQTPSRLHHGFDFMSELNYDVSKDVRIGLNYGRTSGTAKKDFLEILSVNTKTTMIVPRVLYRLPWKPLANMPLRAFAGPIFLRNEAIEVSHEDTDKSKPRLETLKIKGSGTGITAGVSGEYLFSDRLTIGFEGGYRFLKAKPKSSYYSITKIDDPLGDNPTSGLKNDRTLRADSYLWGFMEGEPAYGEEPQIRSIEADYTGVDVRIALRLYLF